MDDFFDDYDDYNDSDFMDEDPFDDEMDDNAGPFQEDSTEESERADDFGLDWQDWMIIGPLSEEIARQKRDIERTIREWDDEDDSYWEKLNRRW